MSFRSHFKRTASTCTLLLALSFSPLPPNTAYADTPEEQLTFASGLYNQKLWDLAAKNLQTFLQNNPKHSGAKGASYQLAAALFRSENGGKVDYARAAQAYERALKDFPDPKLAPQARFELADSYFNLGQFDRAATNYAHFLSTKPTGESGAEAAYMKGESHFALKQWPQAKQAYASVVTGFAQTKPAPFAQLALGNVAEESGKLDEAAVAYQAVWQKYGSSEVAPEARLRAANVWQRTQKWNLARDQFRWLSTNAPKAEWKTSALEGLANTEFGLKNWTGAAQAYVQVLAGAADATPARRGAWQLRLADSQFNAKDYANAATAYAPLTSNANPKIAADALYFRGRSLQESGQSDAALNDFRAIVAKFPTSTRAPRAALLIGDLLAQSKQIAPAAQAYRAVLTKFPKSTEAKDAQEALIELVTPNAQNSTTSRDELESVLRALPPGRAASNAQLRLAQAAFAQSEWKRAAQLAQSTLSAKPDASARAGALYLLASSQLNDGQAIPAANSFRTFLKDFSTNSDAGSARLGLVWALMDAQKWSEAQTEARAALTTLKNKPASASKTALETDLKLALGQALWRAKNYAGATTILANLSSASDATIAAQSSFAAANSFNALNKPKEAAAQWARYAKSSTQPEEQARGFYRQGLALLKVPNSLGAALASFDRAAELDKSKIGQDASLEAAWAASEKKHASASARWAKLRDSSDAQTAATAHFQSGELAFVAKNWSQAAQFYQSAAEKYPKPNDAADAWFQLGSSLWNQKQFAEATSAFERAAGLPGAGASEANFWAGRGWMETNDPARAQPFFARFVAQMATKPQADLKSLLPQAHLGLGRAHLAANDAPRAVTILRAGLTANGNANNTVAAELTFRLAQALFAQGNWKESATQALRVSTLFGQSQWANEAAFLAAEATEKGGDKATANTLYRALSERADAGEWSNRAKERLQVLAP